MGRSRVLVVGLAAIVGVAAIVAGVRLSARNSSATLATDDPSIPQAHVPLDDNDVAAPVETSTTFDIGVLAPTTTEALPSTTTTAPKSTTTTILRDFAIVHVNNNNDWPVKVWIGDETKHQAIVAPGEGVNWVVTTSATNPDSGGAFAEGTQCGGSWTDGNNIVGGREYHFEVKPSGGHCSNGFTMPKLVLTDYTAGASKSFTGLIPKANQALIYVFNEYSSEVKLTLNDASVVEWILAKTSGGAPKFLSTASGHGDGFSVTRTDEECGLGDGEDYFKGGHTYRITVIHGTDGNCESGQRALGLIIKDLGDLSASRAFNADGYLPRTG
ncbi:MAG: hypothetical protein Q8K63_09590 [Acidimicrobiales bacterium]|nr:hypothetical protein [Acidimicrobiales bacterium]